jgi:hypothetical protein
MGKAAFLILVFPRDDGQSCGVFGPADEGELYFDGPSGAGLRRQW